MDYLVVFDIKVSEGTPQVGTADLLLSDSERLARTCAVDARPLHTVDS
jgi:hypothetical protein